MSTLIVTVCTFTPQLHTHQHKHVRSSHHKRVHSTAFFLIPLWWILDIIKWKKKTNIFTKLHVFLLLCATSCCCYYFTATRWLICEHNLSSVFMVSWLNHFTFLMLREKFVGRINECSNCSILAVPQTMAWHMFIHSCLLAILPLCCRLFQIKIATYNLYQTWICCFSVGRLLFLVFWSFI